MASIIAAFSKPQDAGNIRAILRKNGYEPVFACTSGAQVLAAAESLNGGIVVCGFRFEDMVCEELRRLLPSSFDMLLIASPAKWSKRDTEGMICLSMPLKGFLFTRSCCAFCLCRICSAAAAGQSPCCKNACCCKCHHSLYILLHIFSPHCFLSSKA